MSAGNCFSAVTSHYFLLNIPKYYANIYFVIFIKLSKTCETFRAGWLLHLAKLTANIAIFDNIVIHHSYLKIAPLFCTRLFCSLSDSAYIY